VTVMVNGDVDGAAPSNLSAGGQRLSDRYEGVRLAPLILETSLGGEDIKGFVVLPRRWVVERTFSWFGRNRRLTKDFENLVDILTTFVTLAPPSSLPCGGLPECRPPRPWFRRAAAVGSCPRPSTAQR